jgi:hypothetical protein
MKGNQEATITMRTITMRKTIRKFSAVTLGAALALSVSLPAAFAKDNMQGTIVSENSVACGSQTKGKKSNELMCQEYVIRTEATEYHVRQEKEAHKALIPVNAPVEFSLHKDKMKFKAEGKEYEMLVVSEGAIPASGMAAPRP